MIKAELVGGDTVILSFEKVGVRSLVAVKAFVEKFTFKMMRSVMTEKLSGQVLKVRSGNLRRSIPRGTKIVEGPELIRGIVGLGDDEGGKVAKYGRIHEYGGVIPAHDIEIKNKQALMWMKNGTPRFAKRVHIPRIKMPVRSFLRSTLQEHRAEFQQGLQDALTRSIKS